MSPKTPAYIPSTYNFKGTERAAGHTQFMDFLDKDSKISGLQSGNRK